VVREEATDLSLPLRRLQPLYFRRSPGKLRADSPDALLPGAVGIPRGVRGFAVQIRGFALALNAASASAVSSGIGLKQLGRCKIYVHFLAVFIYNELC